MKTIVMSANEYCNYITDGTHDSPKPKDSGYRLITSKHLGRYELDFESANYISKEDYLKVIARSAVEQWDILFSMIGTIGNTYIETNANIEYACKNMGIFKLNGDVGKAKWLYYYLQSPKAREYIITSSRGTTQGYVPLGALRSFPIEVPDDNTVRDKISDFLWNLDEKIKINQRINDNLLQQAQAVFMHIFGDNVSVTVATIADIAINVTDGVHNTVKDDPEGQYLLLSCKNIKGGILSIGTSERRINAETFEKLRRRTKLAKGDILISSVGTVGELLLLNTDPSNYEFQRSVAIVKPNLEIVSSAYVYESLVTKKAELINAAHGAVQQCLFISDIAGFPIGIPEPTDLRSFNEVVNPMFDTITVNEDENLRLEALRDTLLPKLMSGELDVSEVDF